MSYLHQPLIADLLASCCHQRILASKPLLVFECLWSTLTHDGELRTIKITRRAERILEVTCKESDGTFVPQVKVHGSASESACTMVLVLRHWKKLERSTQQTVGGRGVTACHGGVIISISNRADDTNATSALRCPYSTHHRCPLGREDQCLPSITHPSPSLTKRIVCVRQGQHSFTHRAAVRSRLTGMDMTAPVWHRPSLACR